MQAAIEVARASGTLQPDSTKKDPTLEVILSALWNLSSHSRKNKVRIGFYVFILQIRKYPCHPSTYPNIKIIEDTRYVH